MLGYIIRRIVGILPTILVMLVLVSGMLRLLPGDIIDTLFEENPILLSEDERDQLEQQLGLDRSLAEDVMQYSWNALRGDFGRSLFTRVPVAESIKNRAPITAMLGVYTLVVSVIVGIPLGVISAVKQDTFLDYGLRAVALVALSVPNFALAIMAIVLPVLWFGWIPPLRYVRLEDDPSGHLTQFILPAVVLGLALSASLTRMTRTTMLEVLRQDYVRTARAKGATERRVVVRHAMRNAMIPVVSIVGLQVVALFSGTVIIENVFALPGLGRLLLEAVNSRDYPVIQGLVLVLGVLVMLTNLMVDFSYGLLDPRIRLAEMGQ